MVDARKTGAAIAQYRRQRDWTQNELADRLHVTHQAVSRWETGASFPDIAVLADMAELFGVRIDALLGNDTPAQPAGRVTTGAVWVELAEGHEEAVARMVTEKQADFEAVIEAGPLLKPSMMEEILANMKDYTFSFDELTALAPFIGQEILVGIAGRLEGGQIGLEQLAGLAPFLNREMNDRLADLVAGEAVAADQLVALAPFVSRQTIDRLAGRIGGETLPAEDLVGLAPFLSRETLGRLVDRLDVGMDMDDLIGLVPFVDRQVLSKHLERLAPGQITPERLVSLAPFLDHETMDRLAGQLQTNMDIEDLVSLAPFLGRQALEGQIEKIAPGQLTPRHLISLAPFLSSGRER